MITMLTQQVAVWKKEIFDDLSKLLNKYSVIAVADLQKVRSSQIQEIRKKLRGKAELIVAKNTILRKAAEKASGQKENVNQFADSLTGSNGSDLYSNEPIRTNHLPQQEQS